jgi:hypothetical protein
MNLPRHTRFDLSEVERSFGVPPLDAEGFRRLLKNAREDRVSYAVRAYVRDRVPSAFDTSPMLWEAIRAWIAKRLSTAPSVQIFPFEVGITGSASTGFSTAPLKYGKPFSNTSDLDLFVVNLSLFQAVDTDVMRFIAKGIERFNPQYSTLERQRQFGFIDTRHVPANHDLYPFAALVLNEASIVVDKLKIEKRLVDKSHIRVYSDWVALAMQLQRNFVKLRTHLLAQGIA